MMRQIKQLGTWYQVVSSAEGIKAAGVTVSVVYHYGQPSKKVKMKKESQQRFQFWLSPTTALLLVGIGLAASVAQAAVHYQRLKSFGFPELLEQTPAAALIQGSDGALYGTTAGGGVSLNWGTVFKVNKNGSGYTTLYRFGATGSDGHTPQAPL